MNNSLYEHVTFVLMTYCRSTVTIDAIEHNHEKTKAGNQVGNLYAPRICDHTLDGREAGSSDNGNIHQRRALFGEGTDSFNTQTEYCGKEDGNEESQSRK